VKTVTIGDVHGDSFWKDIILDVYKYDKIIFVGDYVDSFTKTNEEIYNNLAEIINFAKEYKDKVVLLLGNHDLPYYIPSTINGARVYWCSGFRSVMWYDLHDLFKNNKDLFLPCYQYKNYLWTHAGVSKLLYWDLVSCSKNAKLNIGKVITEEFENRTPFLFNVDFQRGGADTYGGIFWADLRETYKNIPEDLHQIVGHTCINRPFEWHDEVSSITYTDVDPKEFYIKEIK
jgi:hypothetical protein